MDPKLELIAFVGTSCVGRGTPAQMLPMLKQRFDADPGEPVLIHEIDTGRAVDFDLRGTLDEALARALPATDGPKPLLGSGSAASGRGPGRPRLGVASREVTLLPRHWSWLDAQPSGASPALRRILDAAIRDEPAADRAARIRTALGRMLTALVGNQPGFEEAMRALYRADGPGFAEQVMAWPDDVRELAHERMAAAGMQDAETASQPRNRSRLRG